MAGDQVEITLPKTQFQENSSFTADIRVRTRSTGADATPTTAEYKVVNLTTLETAVDWTTITPAADMTVTIPATANTIRGSSRTRIGGASYETYSLLVSIDRGLSTEHVASRQYRINNLYGVG